MFGNESKEIKIICSFQDSICVVIRNTNEVEVYRKPPLRRLLIIIDNDRIEFSRYNFYYLYHYIQVSVDKILSKLT